MCRSSLFRACMRIGRVMWLSGWGGSVCVVGVSCVWLYVCSVLGLRFNGVCVGWGRYGMGGSGMESCRGGMGGR